MKLRKPTFEGVVLSASAAMVAAIAVSDSVAGMCARVAVVAPLYWADLVTMETASAFVDWSLFSLTI